MASDRVILPRSHYDAIRRVLKLLDGYMANQPQNTLMSDGRGLMTWRELRVHSHAAIGLMPVKKRVRR